MHVFDKIFRCMYMTVLLESMEKFDLAEENV